MKLSIVTLCLALCTVSACSPSKDQPPTKQDAAPAEIVFVKYRGQVDLVAFDCQWVTRSSVVKRLCYDSKEQYVIVKLGGTYYHYCQIPAETVTRWREADSMGRYYDTHVKGLFDCRVNRMPAYAKER